MLSDFRSVLVNATDKPLRLNIRVVSRDRASDLYGRFFVNFYTKKKVLPQLWLRSLRFVRITSYVIDTQKCRKLEVKQSLAGVAYDP